jgi:hypothetical protein
VRWAVALPPNAAHDANRGTTPARPSSPAVLISMLVIFSKSFLFFKWNKIKLCVVCTGRNGRHYRSLMAALRSWRKRWT